MELNPDEARYVLEHLDVFVQKFERAHRRKISKGALQIIHEILTEAAYPTTENKNWRIETND